MSRMHYVLFYFFALTLLFQFVLSRPWLVSSVELRTCGTDYPSQVALNECASTCAPIKVAQEVICAGDTPCTCSIAPPSVLSSCLECHISRRRDGLDSQWITATTNAGQSYTQLCTSIPHAISSAPPTADSLAVDNSTSTSHTLARRESESLRYDDYCIYGFPVITWRFPEVSELPPIITDHNLFIGSFFIVAVVICIILNRKRSS